MAFADEFLWPERTVSSLNFNRPMKLLEAKVAGNIYDGKKNLEVCFVSF